MELQQWIDESKSRGFCRVGKGKTSHLHNGSETVCGKAKGDTLLPLETLDFSPCKTCFTKVEKMPSQDTLDSANVLPVSNTDDTKEAEMPTAARKSAAAKPAAAPKVDATEAEALNVRRREEIAANVERIRSLVEAENVEGVKELKEETDAMIRQLPRKEHTALRATLNAAAKGEEKAKPAPAPKAEVAKPEPKAEVVIAVDEEKLNQLVEIGAAKVIEVARAKFGGGRAVAEVVFDGRLRITKDGVPDVNGDLDASKKVATRMFEMVEAKIAQHAPEVGDDENADAIRAEVNSIKKAMKNAMVDVRVEYARSLDLPTPEAAAERELFAAVLKNEDGSEKEGKPSELVAEFFGFKLQTRAELAKAAREEKAKALEAAKAGGEDGEGEEDGEGVTEGTDEKTPEEIAAAAMRKLVKDAKALNAETVGDLDAETRKKLVADAQAITETLKAFVLAAL